MNEITNADLTGKDIPPKKASWGVILRFAHSFNGYQYWGSFEKCAEIGNNSASLYREKKLLPSTLTELRTSLFYEARRWRHSGADPNQRAMDYIHALIEEIRKRVRTRNIE